LIYNADSYEFIKTMPDESVNLIITDPPYELVTGGNKGCFSHAIKFSSQDFIKICNGFDLSLLDELKRVCKPFNAYIFCSNSQISKLMSWGEENGFMTTLLIWHKPNATPFANGTFKSDLEFIVAMKEKGATFQGDTRLKSKFFQGNVVKDKTTSHPTPKPIDLIRKLMMIGSNKGDVVFDPFLGSGVTAMVAKELGRECIGVEIEKKYYEEALRRVNHTAKGLF
jgi:DNA (cytosine-5-)-methyltransferase